MTPEQFLALAAPLPEPTLLVSRDGVVRAANPAAARLVGEQTDDGPVGRRLAELVGESAEMVLEYLRRCARTRNLLPGALTLRAADGSTFACRAHGCRIAVGDDDSLLLRLIPKTAAVGQFAALNERIAVLHHEVRRRRHAEETARREEERLRVTLKSIGDAVIVTDREARITAVNPIAEQLTGWPQADASGRALHEVFRIVNETSRRTVDNPALRALREGTIVGLANHTILIARDGREHPIDDSAAPIRDDRGIVGAVLVFRDISARRTAERALRESESRFRQLADLVPQIVWAARPDGHIDYYNERWYEFTGLARGVTGDASWTSVLHPDDLTRCLDVYYTCVREERIYEIEYRFKDRHAGRYRWFLGRAVPVRDAGGRVARWFGTCTDIDETKRAELRSSFLARAGALIAEAADPATALQLLANAAVPEFADGCIADLLAPDGKASRVAATFADAQTAQRARDLAERLPLVSADGLPRSAARDQVDCAPVTHELSRHLGCHGHATVPIERRGRTLGALAFFMATPERSLDAADVQAAQELARRAAVALENVQLNQALRDEDRRKDEFLATLAHELRNPLAPIRNGLQLLRSEGIAPEMVQRVRDVMERQLEHMVRIIDDLLDVSRISRDALVLHRATVDARTAVARALETCDPTVRERTSHLRLRMPDEPIWIDADGTRLTQAICNLVTNAAKYTERGGHIDVSLICDGDSAVISVSDDGAGIPTEMLDQIFDMFVQVDRSLERTHAGLGIGLTITKRLVEMHDGTIEARSAGPGMGSEFVVRLPLAAPPSAEAPPARPAPARALARRVLVADDNVDAAETLAAMLTALGHVVRTAHDGVEAAEAAEEWRPDVVLMDIGMPRLNGYAACERIKSHAWSSATLLVAITGWGQASDKDRSRAAGFDHHMVKPIDFAVLENLLARRGAESG